MELSYDALERHAVRFPDHAFCQKFSSAAWLLPPAVQGSEVLGHTLYRVRLIDGSSRGLSDGDVIYYGPGHRVLKVFTARQWTEIEADALRVAAGE